MSDQGTVLSAARDVAAFRLAREYLLTFSPEGVTDAVIDHYIEPTVTRLRPATISGVYLRVLASAQNAHMKASVVGGAIGGVEKLEGVLCGFDPAAVSRCFGNRWEDVLDAVEASGLLPGPVRREPRSIWPLFCRSALSGAAFLSQFADADDFCAWVGRAGRVPTDRAAFIASSVARLPAPESGLCL